MFWTIIKPIYEEFKEKGSSEIEAKNKVCYNSAEIRGSWGADLIKEWNDTGNFLDCSGIETLSSDMKPISYISANDREYKEGYYYVRAHFRLKKGDKVSYNIQDDRHTTAQHILAGLIISGEKIQLQYRDIPFYLNELKLKLKTRTAEHFLEKTYIEKSLNINRRADLLFELETPNLTFGKGIVFEIVNTENKESIREKSLDWAKAGVSLVVVSIENFNFKEYSLKKNNYLIMYRLFDDINVYLELMKKIKQNEPLIDSFNDNVNQMEKKMFFWRSGRHKYEFKNQEKVDEILLYCIDCENIDFKTKSKLRINCYDASNKLIGIDIWEDNINYHSINEIPLDGELLKVSNAYFNEYEGDVSLVLNKYSTIKTIKVIKGGENAERN